MTDADLPFNLVTNSTIPAVTFVLENDAFNRGGVDPEG
jgi:hypothetical protein